MIMATKVQYTVTEALSKIKMLTKQINAYLEQDVDERLSMCAACNSKIGKLDSGEAREDYEVRTRREYQSITDMIKLRQRLRMGVSLSNSQTMVKLPSFDRSITVAEAIALKNDVEERRMLIDKLGYDYKVATQKLKAKNQAAENKALQAKNSILGNDEDTEALNKIADDNYDTIYDRLKYELVDPIKILDEMKTHEDFLSMILHELDYILSVSNTTTVIEI